VKSWIVGGAVAALVLAAGCGRQNANAPSVKEYEQRRAELMKRQGSAVARQATRPKPGQPGEGENAGLVAQTGGYQYESANKRDPFRSFVDEQKLRQVTQERGPLEQFDLNQLTVVAVVWGTGRPRAMVEDPSGHGYVVQVGTAIGKNDGTVLGIGDNSVLVQETYVDYLGAQTTKEIEMRVRSTTQGG